MNENELYCPCCKKIKSKTSFYKSLQSSKDYVPYCRNCVTDKFNLAFEHTESEKAALWSVCMQLNIPFMQEIYEIVLHKIEVSHNRGDSANLFVLYYNTFKEMGVAYTDVTDSDLWFKDLELPQVEDTQEQCDTAVIVEPPQEEVVEEELPQEPPPRDKRRDDWDKIWGKAYNDDDCERLDQYFADYTEEIEEMDTAMILRYRDLCKAELRRFNGDNSKESTEEVLKLMKLLKIDKFEDVKKDETEKFIDRWAWRIENTQPAECEDLQKYKDYAGNMAMWKDIMRTLRNAIAGTRDYPTLEKE